MSLSRALDDALDTTPEGTVTAESDGATAEVEVAASGPIGVTVRRVKVRRGRDVPVEEAARALPDQLARAVPERVEPVEVDPALGGATLRSKPEEMDGDRFFEVEVRGPRDVTIGRYRARRGEPRETAEWSMTREQLGRLLDDLG